MTSGQAFQDIIEVGERLAAIEFYVANSEATVAQRVAAPSDPAKR